MLWRVPRSLWPWRGQASGSLLKSAGLTPHSPSTTGLRTRVWHKGSYDGLVSLPCTSLVFGAWTYLWDRNPPAELPWARRANVRTALASLKCNNCSGFCFTPAAWPAKPTKPSLLPSQGLSIQILTCSSIYFQRKLQEILAHMMRAVLASQNLHPFECFTVRAWLAHLPVWLFCHAVWLAFSTEEKLGLNSRRLAAKQDQA